MQQPYVAALEKGRWIEEEGGKNDYNIHETILVELALNHRQSHLQGSQTDNKGAQVRGRVR